MARDTDAAQGGDEGVVAPEKDAPEQTQVTQDEAPEQPQDEPDLDPVEKLATDIGWRPKEQYKGPEGGWKPADQWIKDTNSEKGKFSRELRDMRGQLDTITKTSAAILQDRLAEERARLAQQYQQAVENGDPDQVWQVSNRLHNVNQQAQQAQYQAQAPTVAPESQDWVSQRPWFQQDPLARQTAVQVAEAYARDGRSTADQLAAADREVRRLFPHHFNTGQRQAPDVSQPGSRSSSQSKRDRTAADMPRAAMDTARSFVESGSLKSVDEYAKFYWENERKAGR